jgi:hypothetical protein
MYRSRLRVPDSGRGRSSGTSIDREAKRLQPLDDRMDKMEELLVYVYT